MATPGERRTLIFIAAIAALGVAVRGYKEARGPDTGTALVAGDRAGLARQIAAVDSAIAAGGEKRRGRGARGTSVAPPRAAPSNRAVTPPREPPPEHEAPPRRTPRARTATPPAGEAARTTSPSPARGGPSPARAIKPPVDLDTAPMDEIGSLAQIGPALARRIVMDRIERGPFGSIGGLERVRGISRALARRLQPYVTFSLASRLESVPEASVPVRTRRRP